jgi:hypothetical protein
MTCPCSVWPKPATIAAALRGQIREVLTIQGEEGTVVGLSSGDAHIKLITTWLPSTSAGAMCERCQTFEKLPDPPASMEAGAQRTALLAPGTRAHAIFALSWLHKFSKRHRECKPPEAEA